MLPAASGLPRLRMRRTAEAMTQAELFEKAGVITKTTGQKALKAMLEAGAIERIGKGIKPQYRYWRSL